VQRVLVAGITGSGKTTYATELGRRLDLPVHSMDALFHGPGWEPIPTFADDVAEVVDGDRWIFDSHGYSEVQELMWARADTVIWLAYPRLVAATRVTRRSFARAWTRDPVFNDNVEPFAAGSTPSTRCSGCGRTTTVVAAISSCTSPTRGSPRSPRYGSPARCRRNGGWTLVRPGVSPADAIACRRRLVSIVVIPCSHSHNPAPRLSRRRDV